MATLWALIFCCRRLSLALVFASVVALVVQQVPVALPKDLQALASGFLELFSMSAMIFSDVDLIVRLQTNGTSIRSS